MRELQLKLLYTVIVAGKSAKFANNVIKKLFGGYEELPFDIIRGWIDDGKLRDNLLLCNTGNYNKIERTFTEIVESDIDLDWCTPEDLEAIHGIGPKSARFYIVWTRPWEEYAVLDVHVLRWLSQRGYDVPRSTPPLKRYKEIESLFLAEAEEAGINPRDLDLAIWLEGSGEENKV